MMRPSASPVALASRALMRITGPDAFQLLQGLVSQDLGLLTAQRVLYGLLLTPQGRLISHFFIGRVQNAFLVELDTTQQILVRDTLTRYCLRQEVFFEELSEWRVYGWLEPALAPTEMRQKTQAGFCTQKEERITFCDPRHISLGGRFWYGPSFSIQRGAHAEEIERYKGWCFKNGLVDGLLLSPGKVLPFDYGLHLLQGISLEKGCYLGQELMARTLHRGHVRRHVFPCKIKAASEKKTVAVGGAVTFAGEGVGRIEGVWKEWVLVRLEIEAAQRAYATQQSLYSEAVALAIRLPAWMPYDWAIEVKQPQ